MAAVYHLRLLGHIEIEKDGLPLRNFRTRKTMALLGYLVGQTQSVSRSHLAEMFWANYPEERGRRNLSRELSQLSSHLPGCFQVDYYTVQFDPPANYWLDTLTFEALVKNKAQDKTSELSWPDKLAEAINLYRGDFMAGHYLDDCPDFETWLVREQEAWRQGVVEVLDRLITHHLAQQQNEPAQTYIRRWLALEPWRERAHRYLMLVLARSDQRSAALAHYDLCRRMLAEELGVEPTAETTALYEQIRTDTLGAIEYPAPGQASRSGPEEIVAAIEAANPADYDAPQASPYRGLFAFRAEDAPFFFGREHFVARVVEAVQQQYLVAIIGPSGSGKTSVAFAGLLHQLRQETPAWLIADFRPGNQPYQALAGALLSLLEPNLSEIDGLVETRKLADALAQGGLSLADVVQRILQKNPATPRLLLLADQFEELYTLYPEPEARQHFLDILLQAISAATPSGLHVVLILRADFMGQALAYRPFADVLQDADVKLGPMTRQELRQVIENPAAKLEVKFEAGLIERILDDVGDQVGHLPLLEFALAALWERQSQRRLTHDAYEVIGQVVGALAHYADEVYAGLSPLEQKQARRIFVQMVQPGEQTEDTRRLTGRAELGEAGWALAQRLADARLLVTNRDIAGQETAEVVHEALIRGWGHLRAWLNEDRLFRVWQERLRMALRQWQGKNRDEEALLRGGLLAEAEEWAKLRSNELSLLEWEFLQASLTRRDQRLSEQEAQRRRELDQAQALAEAEHQRAIVQAQASRRLRWLVAGLALVFVVAVGAALWARLEQQQAQQQARLALSRQLAAQANFLIDKNIDTALLLSLEAERLLSSAEDKNKLLTGLKLSPFLETILHSQSDNVFQVDFSPNGQLLAAVTSDGLTFWKMANLQPLALTLKRSVEQPLDGIAFSPDGQTIATGSRQGGIMLWDATSLILRQTLSPNLSADVLAFSPDGKTLAVNGNGITLWDLTAQTPLSTTLTGHKGWISTLAFSPDGHKLASGGQDGLVMLWDVAARHRLGQPLTGHTDWVLTVAFSPDSRTLVSGDLKGTLIWWDVASRQMIGEPLTQHTSRVYSVAYSPDGQSVVSGGGDNKVIMWDVANLQAIKPIGGPLIGHTNWIRSLKFSPDSKTLVSGGMDGKVILWDITRGRFFNQHTAPVRGITFSPNGQTLVSSSLDKTIIIWDVATGKPVGTPLIGHKDWLLNLDLSPDGKILASASADKTVRLWDMATLEPLGQPLVGHLKWAIGLDFSPDGTKLVTSGSDAQVILWDVASQQMIGRPMLGHTDWVLAVAFSPDGTKIASVGQDNLVIVWDVATQRPLAKLTEHTNWVNSVAFSPDGQLLATGSTDNTIILWDTKTFSPIQKPLTGHTARIWSLRFNPADHGKTLISAGADGAVIVWDVATGQPLFPPLFSNMEMETMDLSPDGQTVAIAGFNNQVAVWKLNLEAWAKQACRIANRNLTQAEWAEFIGPSQPYRRTCPDLPLSFLAASE